MLRIESVFFDNLIPNWLNNPIVLQHNVLLLVTQGKVNYTINGNKIIAEKGDVIFIPEGSNRSSDNYRTELHQKYAILFYCNHGDLGLPFLKNKQLVNIKIRNYEYVKQRFTRLYWEKIGSSNYSLSISIGILQELLGMIAREMETSRISPIQIKYAQEIQLYLNEHYRQSIHIDQLARLIDRTPNYMTSLFKEVIGQSPIQYLHYLRITEACNLLLNSNMTITEISSYLGYYDTSFFFRMFKKFTSLSPSTYKTQGNLTLPAR